MSSSARPARVGFVTIGQSPRDDIVPEIRDWVGLPFTAVERGALDGLSPDAIRALEPTGDEPRLVSRLRDGSEATLAAARVHARVSALLTELDGQALDAIVLLCTGHFPPAALQTPFVPAQAVVDHGVTALAAAVRTLGVLVPHEAQAREAERRGWPLGEMRVVASHSTPYRDSRFAEAARELADADLIVMHCMGYDEAMLARVRAATRAPVLLARRLVAGALRQLL